MLHTKIYEFVIGNDKQHPLTACAPCWKQLSYKNITHLYEIKFTESNIYFCDICQSDINNQTEWRTS